MPGIQTRSQKSKVKPKIAEPAAIAAAKPNQDNARTRPLPEPATGAQERETSIARAAYFRAEKRGFAPGGELQDWVEAEAELLRLSGGV